MTNYSPEWLEERSEIMFKTKFITSDTTDDLQTRVNSFIKNKKIINISYTMAGGGYAYLHSCCILYEE